MCKQADLFQRVQALFGINVVTSSDALVTNSFLLLLVRHLLLVAMHLLLITSSNQLFQDFFQIFRTFRGNCSDLAKQKERCGSGNQRVYIS